MTFAHDESWCWNQGCPTDYAITWAREFRYDGARARYMNRKLDPAGLLVYPPVYTGLSTTWSDYDGDEIYGDFEMASGSPVNKRSFEPGIGRTENPLTTPVTNYYHGDMLGTTRLMTTNPPPPGTPTGIEPAVYTAFGEHLPGSAMDRFGFVGAWGYQAATSDTPGDPYITGFPYLHVGARYYDPSSGRFLQRDPIGIRGGLNSYLYVSAIPTVFADPSGLYSLLEGAKGAVIAGAGALVCGATGGVAAVVAAIGLINGIQQSDLEEAWEEYLRRNLPPKPTDPWWCPKCREIVPGDERHLHAG